MRAFLHVDRRQQHKYVPWLCFFRMICILLTVVRPMHVHITALIMPGDIETW